MKQVRPFLLISWLCLFACTLLAQNQSVGWDIRSRDPLGELEYDPRTGLMHAPTGVIITYGDVVLTADKVTANEKTGDVLAEGNVTIKGQGQMWTGERMAYNFKTRQMNSDAFKTTRSPFFVAGQGLTSDRNNDMYTATNAVITTDDYYEPAYKVRARKLTLVPGEYIEAEHAVLYLGNLPVFYLPKYNRSLKRHPNNFEFEPGYRSLHGAYLLSTFNYFVNTNFDGSIHFDMRQKRGFGGGPAFNYDFGDLGIGRLEYYYAKDDEPGLDFLGGLLPTHRQRLLLNHRSEIETNLFFKTRIAYQSDPFVVRDFFEREYRDNVQPNTFAEFNRAWQNWTLDALVQPQINDFFETVERLPDLRLSGLRQQLGETPFYYDSESTMGYYQRRFATGSINSDYSAFRGDTYHQVTLPRTFFGWLNFTPRVGGRLTYYSEAQGRGGAGLEEEFRAVFNTGAELSTKASRVWNGARSRFWDVDGIRHIIEPSINYVFVPEPGVRPRDLPQFDYELPSLRLLPIEFPHYNAIDSIDSQNVIRFTLRNKLQTKRHARIENLVNWALYTDWRLDPIDDRLLFGGGRTNQSTFADLYSDLDIRPRSWITFNSETRFDIERGRWREANHRITFLPNDRWSFTIGHRYLDDDPQLGPPPTGHNLIYDSFYYRLNENWGWHMSHYFEARDGTMEEQYYTIYRDLRSWTAALTFRLRDSRTGPYDFTVAISFSLKAFPRFKLNDDRDKPWQLIGG